MRQSSHTIFNQLAAVATSEIRMSFCKHSLLVKEEVFAPFAHLFPCKGDTLKGNGMRTREFFRHLHANQHEGYVEVHLDNGNIAKSLPLGLLHLIFDVLPHLFYCLIVHRRYVLPFEEHQKRILF